MADAKKWRLVLGHFFPKKISIWELPKMLPRKAAHFSLAHYLLKGVHGWRQAICERKRSY